MRERSAARRVLRSEDDAASDEDRRATRARGIGRRLCASDLEQLITLGNEPCVRTES